MLRNLFFKLLIWYRLKHVAYLNWRFGISCVGTDCSNEFSLEEKADRLAFTISAMEACRRKRPLFSNRF